MITWNRIVTLALVGCIFALCVKGKRNELCDKDSDCFKDSERCFKDSVCKKGTCLCNKGYWVQFSSVGSTCIKDIEYGDSCNATMRCTFTHTCRKCPENTADPNAKSVCLNRPGAPSSSVIPALKITMMLVSLVISVFIVI